MKISELIDKIKNMNDCYILKPIGLPILEDKHFLPNDLKEFYQLCGGIKFFVDTPYALTVLPPDKFCLANPIIVGELCEEDISSEWYTICEDMDGNFVTIDLNNIRQGRCYDSYWDRHGVVGECAIIANNFSELLFNIINSKRNNFYWLEDDFNYIGDAYDDL